VDEPLSVMMPLSCRSEGEAGGANQVCMDVVTLADPGAGLPVCLTQVHENSHALKARTRQLPIALRQLYTVFIAGRATLLSDLSPLFNEVFTRVDPPAAPPRTQSNSTAHRIPTHACFLSIADCPDIAL
jgi:hypothetical protein